MASSSTPNAMLLGEEQYLSQYLPLYKAAIQGDWDTASGFLDIDPEALTARITRHSETVLHVAAGTRKAIGFLTNLLDLIPSESLETLVDSAGRTALHSAAIVGNIEAATILVARNQRLPNTWSRDLVQVTPLLVAATFGHREMTSYLLSVTMEDVDPNPFAGELGVWLLNTLIIVEFYDMALQLVERNPELGTVISPINGTPLGAIAGKPSAFPSGTQYNPWQWFIYSLVPLNSGNVACEPNVGDLENPRECCTKMSTWVSARFIHVCQKVYPMIWSMMEILIPQMKNIKETKQMHSQTLQLVRFLCTSPDIQTATRIFRFAVHSAAKLGIYEIAEEILECFPSVGGYADEKNNYIFHHAVINRREKVFNLLYQLSEHNRLVLWHADARGNSILHLAGKLAPSDRINLVSGAALQMQRELQWYKEVRKWSSPEFEGRKNEEGKTPAMVFTEEHKELVKEGERWMKDTANSCSLSAALIATIAFAAAITVPGGTDGDSGFPIFSKEVTFIIFAISNAISLFSSSASLLMFLSILTARYAEGDFLFSLPRRLIIGLITLFLSITAMMIAFSATLYLVLGHRRAWVLVPVAGSACLPVTLFVTLQFPLLLEIIRSTYGRGMFGLNNEGSGSRD